MKIFFETILLRCDHSRERERHLHNKCGSRQTGRWSTVQKAPPERLDAVTKGCPKRCVLSDRPLLIEGSIETGSYILVGTAAGEQTFD
jgi:hypothetical protein